MKVQVVFTVDVDSVSDHKPLPSLALIEAGVAEAVTNAIQHAQGQGHSHSLENDISILMDSEVMAYKLTKSGSHQQQHVASTATSEGIELGST